MNAAREEIKHWQLLALTLFFCVAMTFMEAQDPGFFTAKQLASSDPDSWLRLTLVQQLVEGSDWFNHHVARLDPPLGMTSPWTRPVDVLLAVFSAPFIALLGMKMGLLWGAVLYSQGLLFVGVAILLHLYRRMGAEPLGILATLFLFLFNPFIFGYYNPLNADHHALLVFLAIASLWWADRWASSAKTGDLIWLGAALGLGIWVSVEFMLFAAAVGGWVLWPWLFGRLPARLVFSFVLSCTLVLLAGWLLEHSPADLMMVHYDTLSRPYLFLALAASLASMGLMWVEAHLPTWRKRLGAVAVFYGAALGVTLLLFPALPQGAMAETTDFMRENFLPSVYEMQPLYSDKMLLVMLCAILWLVAVVHAVRQKGEGGRMAALHALLATVFFFYALLHQRMYYYGVPSLSLLVGAAVAQWLTGRHFPDAVKALTIVLTGMMPLLTTFADQSFKGENKAETGFGECHEELFTHLLDGSLTTADQEKGVWLVHPNIGAQVLFASKASILASNYHRNARGYQDFMRLAKVATDEEALALVKMHGLRLLALCEGEKNAAFFTRAMDETTRPSWLEADKTLNVSDKQLRLFRVLLP